MAKNIFCSKIKKQYVFEYFNFENILTEIMVGIKNVIIFLKLQMNVIRMSLYMFFNALNLNKKKIA